MVGFGDRLNALPPCVVCGSTTVKANNLNVTLVGNWKGYWICENDHRNTFN
jgi:hypothetical protein